MRRLVDLHDSALLGIECSWEERSVTFRMKWDGEAEVHLVGRGLRELSFTQRDPWGPSVFVNSVEVTHHPPDEELLVLEMQSGDVIRAVADVFEERRSDD